MIILFTGVCSYDALVYIQSKYCIFRWYNIDCAAQPDFYSLNQFIYDSPEEGEALVH